MRRVRGRALRAAAAGLLVLLGGAAARAQRYEVEIQKEVFQRIPLAIAGFAPLPDGNPGADLATVARSVVAADLDFTGLFEVIDPTFLPVDVRQLKPGDQAGVLPMLALFKVQGLLLGTLERRGTELALEGHAYDVERGTAIVARRYLGDATAVRQIAHRLADEIVFRYTGERGVAQTRVAYVAARRNVFAFLTPNLGARLAEHRKGKSGLLGVTFGLSAPLCAAPLLFFLLAGSFLVGAWEGFLVMFVFGLGLSLPIVFLAKSRRGAAVLSRIGRKAAHLPLLVAIVFVAIGLYLVIAGLLWDPFAGHGWMDWLGRLRR
ncbi:MAG: hypothetical protein HY575_08835 [candidate division NC10 bacterium]|nr:hypothetical protein [candidate division NC10 bacterium]